MFKMQKCVYSWALGSFKFGKFGWRLLKIQKIAYNLSKACPLFILYYIFSVIRRGSFFYLQTVTMVIAKTNFKKCLRSVEGK